MSGASSSPSSKAKIPPPLQMLFSLGQGKVRMVGGSQGEGFYVVKVNKIIPGNALNQPGLIARTQTDMQESLSQEYGAAVHQRPARPRSA